jgi:hypothetical protein
MLRQVKPWFSGTGTSETLVVALHGCIWTSRGARTQLRHVLDAAREVLPDADVFAPRMPIEYWSLREPDRIVSQVLAGIDTIWQQRCSRGSGEYRDVVLIGFSFGSVLLRQVFCAASGARDDATIDVALSRPWANRVTRIVLLSGLNRGWTVESPVSRFTSLTNNVGSAIGHLLPRKPTLFGIRRGAPFLTLTRLQWMALNESSHPPPITVQLLGTKDDIVSPADNVDLATGGDFVYLDVPQSGHFDVIDVRVETSKGRVRRACFQTALIASLAELRRVAIGADDVAELLPISVEDAEDAANRIGSSADLQDVVFIVHGIRDKGFWTRKMAREVKMRARGRQRHVVTIAPTYGYFAILPFLCPWSRRSKVEWLLDQYVTVRALYPNASISFIGHSNGTYILAGGVQRCRAIRFKNVVFAGSVVQSNFDWVSLVQSRQVERVLNYVATSDWVVAIFPRLFQLLRLQDLGGAGHDGFDSKSPSVVDVEYIPGRHSIALEEQNWADIASFVLDGETPSRAVVPRRHVLTVAAGYAAPLIWLFMIATALVPGYLALTALGFPELTGVSHLKWWQSTAAGLFPGWLLAVILMIYWAVLRTVLTKL